MTKVESLMLAICFGALIGSIIGDIAVIVKFKIDEHKEKKRKKQEENKQ